ncbi:hypothetical protein QR680_011060 [Steinernema hermaphroditum]|uniref:G-protein coupled receptors family 1 profile domain-containing protein n=1 Tax=Steinernema hermaphroditum TaxID=289476 RepID=A0AA39ITH3_9BILA|nr:hypothetical protein QR680_011060 [Steinernema hermaphroditum]
MLLLAVVFFPLISSAHSECWNDRLVSKSECIPVGDWTEAIKEQCDTIDNLKFEENCAGIEFKAVNFSCCSPMKGCKGVESARWPFLTTATHFPTSQLIGSIRRGDYSGFKIQFTLQETLDKLTGLMTMFASNTRDCGYDKLGDKADSFLSSYHSIMAKLTGENNKRTKVLHEVLMSIIDGKSTCSLEEQLEEFNIDKLIEKHANRSLKAFPELKEKLEDQLIELQISSTPGILRKHLSFLKDDDASRRVIDLYKQLIKKKDFSIITEEESKHPVGVNSTKNETIHVPDSVKGLVKETLKITPMSDAEVPDMIKPKELISPLSLAFKKIVSLFTDRLTEKFSDYADKKKEDRLSRIDPLGPPSLPGPISSLQTVLSMIPGGSEENESIESGLGGPLSSILALSSLGSGGSKERAVSPAWIFLICASLHLSACAFVAYVSVQFFISYDDYPIRGELPSREGAYCFWPYGLGKNFMVVGYFIAILATVCILIVFSLLLRKHLIKMKNVLSTKTLELHRKFLFYLLINTAVPLIFGAVPLSISLLCTVFPYFPYSREITMIATFIAANHGTVYSVVSIVTFQPYLRTAQRMVRQMFQRTLRNSEFELSQCSMETAKGSKSQVRYAETFGDCCGNPVQIPVFLTPIFH